MRSTAFPALGPKTNGRPARPQTITIQRDRDDDRPNNAEGPGCLLANWAASATVLRCSELGSEG